MEQIKQVLDQDNDMTIFVKTSIPEERKFVQKRLQQLKEELEVVQNFEKEFTSDMYEGVDADDRAKLTSYVSFFSEFKSAINRDTAAL